MQWLAIAAIIVSLIVIGGHLPIDRLLDALGALVLDLGPWGPLLYAGFYALAAVLLVPGSALTLAAGAIFGLGAGVVAVSTGATLGAMAAFSIARRGARPAVEPIIRRHPKFHAIDRAISEGGWKVVALLRLTPVVPFNVSNYLFGLTAVRFVPYALATWVFMLPGALMYVYLGHLGGAGLGAATGRGPRIGALQWTLWSAGLAATIAAIAYITRRARRALAQYDSLAQEPEPMSGLQVEAEPSRTRSFPAVTVAIAVLAVAGAIGTVVFADALRGLFGPPAVVAAEVYADQGEPTGFEHGAFDALLRAHVDADGWVDYAALQRQEQQLDAYLATLATAPFDAMPRDEKLAFLINAYNAFTLKLILEHYPTPSIRDIPEKQRWDARRWELAGQTVSLNQIEHEMVRPRFKEPRIHFALVCAAVGCPKLLNRAYAAERLEAQLEAQTRYAHEHDRWFRYDAASDTVYLTKLYDWYGGDFEQTAGGVLEYASRYVPTLKQALDQGRSPSIRWLDYDWKLNERAR